MTKALFLNCLSELETSHEIDLTFYMGQNIEEWTKSNLWVTAFKIFEGLWSA